MLCKNFRPTILFDLPGILQVCQMLQRQNQHQMAFLEESANTDSRISNQSVYFAVAKRQGFE